MNACHGNVTRDVTGGVTLPRPDPTRPISSYASIDLTVVGVEAPPETWMDLEDLNLLDDDKRHARCNYCQPVPKTLDVFDTICGRKAIARVGTPTYTPPPNACLACLNVYVCPKCGAC